MSIVLLPSEIYHREFDAKLILAMRLVQDHNCMVLVGYDKHFNNISKPMPPALLMDKSCSSMIWKGRIKNIMLSGGNAIVNDEEGFNGLSRSNKNSFLNRVDDLAACSIKKYLCWGEIDFKFFSQVKQLCGKSVVLGNCRSDLLSERGRDFYSDESQALQRIYGNFVLCSDNFGVEDRSGPYLPPQFNDSDEVNKLANIEFEKRITELKRRREIYCQVLEEAVVKLPYTNFILRPHPRSDQRWWVNRFWKYRNFHIIYHLNIEPWIHSAAALLSMGCTSALQSIVAGTPVIEIVDKNQHFASAQISGYALKFTNLHVSSGAELIQALGDAQDKKSSFNSVDMIDRYWHLCRESTASIRFSELMGEFIPPFNPNNLRSLQDMLSRYSVFYKKYGIRFNDTKWHKPQLSTVIRKLNSIAKSFELRVPKIYKVCESLYLIGP